MTSVTENGLHAISPATLRSLYQYEAGPVSLIAQYRQEWRLAIMDDLEGVMLLGFWEWLSADWTQALERLLSEGAVIPEEAELTAMCHRDCFSFHVLGSGGCIWARGQIYRLPEKEDPAAAVQAIALTSSLNAPDHIDAMVSRAEVITPAQMAEIMEARGEGYTREGLIEALVRDEVVTIDDLLGEGNSDYLRSLVRYGDQPLNDLPLSALYSKAFFQGVLQRYCDPSSTDVPF